MAMSNGTKTAITVLIIMLVLGFAISHGSNNASGDDYRGGYGGSDTGY